MPSNSTRRGFLALCGASMTAGCSVPLFDGAVSLPVPTGAGDWPSSAGDARRTHTNADADGPTGPVEPAWTADGFGGKIAVSTAENGVSRVYAFDRRNDASRLAVLDGSGEVGWAVDHRGTEAVTLVDGVAVVPGLGPTLRAFADGSVAWSVDLGGSDTLAPPVATTAGVFATTRSTDVYGVAPGDQRWHAAPPRNRVPYDAVVAATDSVVLRGCIETVRLNAPSNPSRYHTTVDAYDPATGDHLWNWGSPGFLYDLVVDGHALVAVAIPTGGREEGEPIDRTPVLFALDTENGLTMRRVRLDVPSLRSMAAGPDGLVLATTGGVHAFDASLERRWSARPDGEFLSLVRSSGTVYALRQGVDPIAASVVAFDAANGEERFTHDIDRRYGAVRAVVDDMLYIEGEDRGGADNRKLVALRDV
ncbi:PQQ-binding-like beta-propeller repeat protein [Halomarina litorea]|uniref:PQQ-binding-like beta-propeller repeat protein n=1 Tax=Halomarina litorea TaxID=2961595 RepID=UPI0020C5A4C1|nr:PQQ-binding-like beta-propeller repeat protein [Halomarina sp. BCD28]